MRRLGGIAGNMAFAAELDTGQLPESEASRLQAVLGDLPWGQPAADPPYPDAFRYEVAVPDEPDRGTAVLQEDELTGDLGVLRDELRRTGVVEPARRRPG